MSDWIHFIVFVDYLFWDILEPNRFKAFSRLCRAMTKLISYHHDRAALAIEEQELRAAVGACQEVFPLKFSTHPLHALTHLYEDIALCGPVYEFWSLPFERWMRHFRSNVWSKRDPATNFINRHTIRQRLHWMSSERCRELRDFIHATGYTPSKQLSAALGMLPTRDGFQFKAVASRSVSDDLVSAISSYLVVRWGCRHREVITTKWRRERRSMHFVRRHEVEDIDFPKLRLDFTRDRLREMFAVRRGLAMEVSWTKYGSLLRAPRCATIWFNGADLYVDRGHTWSGMWHGEIAYFVRVRRKDVDDADFVCTCLACRADDGVYLAAVRVFPAQQTSPGPAFDTTIVSGELYQKIYFLPVERIGGRSCLCDYGLGRRWVVYVCQTAY
jgi:hypothetical protein